MFSVRFVINTLVKLNQRDNLPVRSHVAYVLSFTADSSLYDFQNKTLTGVALHSITLDIEACASMLLRQYVQVQTQYIKVNQDAN